MSEDKQPMQAPGDAEAAREEGARGAGGETGGGESGGGAYPNPHEPGTGKPDDGVMGHGGQTEIAYYGPGHLGDRRVGPDDAEEAAERAG